MQDSERPLLVLAVLTLLAIPVAGQQSSGWQVSRLPASAPARPSGIVPLAQSGERAFAAFGLDWSVRFGVGGVTLSRDDTRVRIQFSGASAGTGPEPLEPAPGEVNLFLGGAPGNWRTGLPSYGAVAYRAIYPGIDLHYRIVEGRLKSEFYVAPGADPAQIEWTYEGALETTVDADGALVYRTPAGEGREDPPVAFQISKGRRTEVETKFAVDGEGRARFAVGPYDRSLPLVIDPAIRYSTFLGGSDQDWGQAIAVDASGNLYVAGDTTSLDFPSAPATSPSGRRRRDAFLAKFSPSYQLLYVSFFGGSLEDRALSVRTDSAGSVYLAGWTISADFPSQPAQALRGARDGYVAKLSADGRTLQYLTLVGGSGSDECRSLAVDSAGGVLVGGFTTSNDLPFSGGFQPAAAGDGDGFVLRLAPDGRSVTGGAYVGGSKTDAVNAVAYDPSGFLIAAGFTDSPNLRSAGQPLRAAISGLEDAFIGSFRISDWSARFLTYWGGSSGDYEQAAAVAVDTQGNVIVTGTTTATDFPLEQAYQTAAQGVRNGFLTKLTAAGSLQFSTYFGGSGNTQPAAVAIDGLSNIWLAGTTSSVFFPLVSPIQTEIRGAQDGFVARFSADGRTLGFSSYLGGSQYEGISGIAVGASGRVFVTGYTGSLDFSASRDGYQKTLQGTTDLFLAEVDASGVNNAPVANPDTAETSINTPVTIPVLANDRDPDGDPLFLQGFTPGFHGTVTRNPDSSVVYTPSAAFTGSDSFTYLVGDDRFGLASGTVTITVKASGGGNSSPVAANDAATVQAGDSINIAVLANDRDPDGDPLVLANVVPPSAGTATINADGTIRYTSQPGSTGQVHFEYVVDDGRGGRSRAEVTITVAASANTAPVAGPDVASTRRGAAVEIPVLLNDGDADADSLQVVSVTQGKSGAVTLGAGQVLRYQPNGSFTGQDQFTYTLSDGRGGQAAGLVTVTVSDSANQPPSAQADQGSTAQGKAIDLAVLANDTDPDNDSLLVIGATQGASGTVSVQPDRTVRYTPAAGFVGTDSFVYLAADQKGGQSVGRVSVSVVAAANQPPVAQDDAAITERAAGVRIPALANDSDPDGDALTVLSFTQGCCGEVTSHPDGTLFYTPNINFLGNDLFEYTISDGRGGTASARVTVAVRLTGNTAPVAADDTAATLLNTPVNVQVLLNDTDANGDTITIVSAAQGRNGVVTINPDRTLRYTPQPGFLGVDRFGYTISDGRGGQSVAGVRITVAPPGNSPPVATNDVASAARDSAITVPVLSNDADADGEAIFVVRAGPPGNGTASVQSGSAVVYTPAPGFAGVDRFSYTIADARGLEASATVTITVASGNSQPIARDDVASVAPGSAVDVAVLANDSAASGGGTLTVAGVSSPAKGSAVILSGQTIRYTAQSGATGSDQFRYTVSDGKGGTASALVTVTFIASSTQPVARNDAATTATRLAIDVPVLKNDSGTNPSSILSVVQAGAPGHGSASINADGTLRYLSAAGFVGIDTFSYTIGDGSGKTASATVTVTVLDASSPAYQPDRLVPQMYSDVFGRGPTVDELNTWKFGLSGGTATRLQFALSLLTGEAAQPDSQFLVKGYNALVGRGAEVAAWDFWRSRLRNGATRKDVARAILRGPEFRLGAGPLTNADFVNLLYRRVFSRSPSAAEAAALTSRLVGGAARELVLTDWLSQVEVEQQMEDDAVSGYLCLALLRRMPTDTNTAQWRQQLAQGAGIADLVRDILDSSDYVGRFPR